MLANQIRPTALPAAIVSRYTSFWPNRHRELPFLAIVLFVYFVVFFLLSLELCRLDVPLIFFCPADPVVPGWQPRILLGMVEARTVDVNKTTTIFPRITSTSIYLNPLQ